MKRMNGARKDTVIDGKRWQRNGRKIENCTVQWVLVCLKVNSFCVCVCVRERGRDT